MAANLRSRINAGRGLSTPAALRQSVRCGSPYVANWPDGLGWRIVLRDVCMSGPIRAGHQSHSSSARKGGQSRSNGHNHYHPTRLDVAELDTFRNTTVRSQFVAHGIVQVSVSDSGRGCCLVRSTNCLRLSLPPRRKAHVSASRPLSRSLKGTRTDLGNRRWRTRCDVFAAALPSQEATRWN